MCFKCELICLNHNLVIKEHKAALNICSDVCLCLNTNILRIHANIV